MHSHHNRSYTSERRYNKNSNFICEQFYSIPAIRLNSLHLSSSQFSQRTSWWGISYLRALYCASSLPSSTIHTILLSLQAQRIQQPHDLQTQILFHTKT